MPGAIDATLRKFHASLNVSDLERSIAFYRALLGAEPAKVRSDYAKFDIRVDKETMTPYFIDANPNTALGPGDQPMTQVMGMHGVDFPDILASLLSKHVESPERPKEI